MSLARRRLLHSRAADALARRHAADRRGTPGRRWSPRTSPRPGATRSRVRGRGTPPRSRYELYAHREALAHLTAALGHGFDPARVHRASGDALLRLGRYARGHRGLRAGCRRRSTRPTPWTLRSSSTSWPRSTTGWVTGWSPRRTWRARPDLLQPDGPPQLRAQVAADLALVLRRQGLPEAGPVAQEALALAERSGDAAAARAGPQRARSAGRGRGRPPRRPAALRDQPRPRRRPYRRRGLESPSSTTWPACTPPRGASTRRCSRRRKRWPWGPGTGTCTGSPYSTTTWPTSCTRPVGSPRRWTT